MLFPLILAILATIAVIGLRVWMLRRIKDAQTRGERPFDKEDTPRNPYM